ncbi:hypothetical protein A9D60_05045 [Leisingera sp. JC1]|nr:hypothetical protein A9D60_05045 [Leisingera sp. JC1]
MRSKNLGLKDVLYVLIGSTAHLPLVVIDLLGIFSPFCLSEPLFFLGLSSTAVLILVAAAYLAVLTFLPAIAGAALRRLRIFQG